MLEFHSDVEVLLVGGAAAIVTNQLVGSRTTTDFDVMPCSPEVAKQALEVAAARIAEELELAPRRFNSDVQMLAPRLPEGWERRRVFVCHSGRLRVWAVGRVDLLTMNVIAGRAQDFEDVRAMGVRFDERAFIREQLQLMAHRNPTDADIVSAVDVLEALNVRDHE